MPLWYIYSATGLLVGTFLGICVIYSDWKYRKAIRSEAVEYRFKLTLFCMIKKERHSYTTRLKR